jgi:hypothetical protein
LELAAYAAGIKLEWVYNKRRQCDEPHAGTINSILPWNPISNDGDALRLAAATHLTIDFEREIVCPEQDDIPFARMRAIEEGDKLDYCRAIVRAAAEIGRAMI